MRSNTIRSFREPTQADGLRGSGQWHAIEARDSIEILDTRQEGLSQAEAVERLVRHGANTIVTARPDGPLWLLLRQLNSPLLFVLLGSGGIALLLGKVTDGAVVLGVVALNAIIGFIQEFRAQKAITALGQMVPETATVRRDGRVAHIPAAEVAPGDIVLLQSGDRVPADLRLLSVKSLHVDESALTGEAVPVAKQVTTVPGESGLGETARACRTAARW